MEGRQPRSFTDDYKRQAVDLVASSGRSIGSVAKELGLRDSVSVGGAAWGQAGADGSGAAPHNAGDAAVGGPRDGDYPSAAGERAAAHGARYFKKLFSAVARLCGLRNSLVLSSAAGRVAAVRLLEAQSPLKKRGPWVHANLRVVTSPWRRSRLGR
jgi:hypothetical protein